MRVDVVREREDRVGVRVVPLHRDLDIALVALALEVRDVLVGGLLRLVDVRDEVADAAGGEELLAVLALALVDEDDPQALGQERGLAEALGEPFRVPLGLLEDLGVGLEADRRAGLLGRPDRLHLRRRLAAGELLHVGLPVALDSGDQPLGERVDDRDADAVEAAGDLVAALAELPAGVQLGQDDRQRGQALVFHHVHRDARAVVFDGHRLVRVDGHLEVVAAAREGLVDRVRDHLVGEVMEAPGAGRADVHPGPFPDRVEPFEDRDVLCAVSCFRQNGNSSCRKAKALQIGTLRAAVSVSETEVGRALERPRATALFDQFCAGFRPRSRRRATPPLCRASSVGSGTSVRASAGLVRGRLGQVAGDEFGRFRRIFRRAPGGACSRISAASWPSSNAQDDDEVFTCSVPSRAIRAGQAFAATIAPTAAGQAASELRHPALRAEARELLLDLPV